MTASDDTYLIFSFALISDSKLFDIVNNKSKSIAWFVSNCNAISGRDRLTQKLQEFVDVDVYGKCGTLRCDRSSSECYEMLRRDYKFYLSFENSLCNDYVTEKVFKPMMHNIIPVVYSGAEISRFLPPKSYINAESFETAKDLALYLKFLIQTPSEYIKYFWWKKHYKVVQPIDVDLCSICKKLNEPGFYNKTRSYKSISNWYSKNSCRKQNIKF